MGGEFFYVFCWGLENNPCAATLTVLSLKTADLSSENVQAFAAIVAKMSLPSLRESDFSLNDKIKDESVSYIVEGLATAGTALD